MVWNRQCSSDHTLTQLVTTLLVFFASYISLIKCRNYLVLTFIKEWITIQFKLVLRCWHSPIVISLSWKELMLHWVRSSLLNELIIGIGRFQNSIGWLKISLMQFLHFIRLKLLIMIFDLQLSITPLPENAGF